MAKDRNTAMLERAFKARALYEAHLYEPTPEGLLVFSQSGEGCYLVTDAGCTCPDATEGFAARLLEGHCKHVELRSIVERAAQPGPRRLPPAHDAGSVYHRATPAAPVASWRAECGCGWVGAWRAYCYQADADAAAHNGTAARPPGHDAVLRQPRRDGDHGLFKTERGAR
jgi:hypothetical protein